MDEGLINNNGEKVKISGDGAKMSRIANFIVLSFSIISDEEKIMSAYGKKALCNAYNYDKKNKIQNSKVTEKIYEKSQKFLN
jgi:hypothetical protein